MVEKFYPIQIPSCDENGIRESTIILRKLLYRLMCYDPKDMKRKIYMKLDNIHISVLMARDRIPKYFTTVHN